MEISLALLLILSPFAGFAINLFLGNMMKKKSGWLSTACILISFAVSVFFFIHINTTKAPVAIHLFDWIRLSGFNIGMDLLFDRLSVLWLLFVTGIGALIHIYSIGYMRDDENKDRFFAYMNLFIFFMQLLVAGGNLLVTFIGWEGVGLCSYLLIGFWHENPGYNDAAKKAFIMNRVGDLGFLVGAFTLAHLFGTLDYTGLRTGFAGVLAANPEITGGLTLSAICLFLGATGKSAQIPLHTWLPDAMAGPTPVSALIHAATMVTGGVFLITRMGFLYTALPDVRLIIAVVGTITALFAATIGLTQTDIKKVLAYSTISQLGLMFLALGMGAYTAAVFHVVTHAFFKACLFLGAGSVIHGLGGEQDMRRMGGVKPAMLVTYATFLIATLAISGIPPFAGFFSKDEILLAAFGHNKVLWGIASLASVFTAFYMFRALFLTFSGEFRGSTEEKRHIHESPKTMTVPLIVLASLSVVGGLLGIPGHSWLGGYLAPVLPEVAGLSETSGHTHHPGVTEYALMGLATVGALTGIAIAYWQYIRDRRVPRSDEAKTGFGKIIYRKFYVDELYDMLVVKPLYQLSTFFANVFEVVFYSLLTGTGRVTGQLSLWVRSAQNGNIGRYLVVFVFGVCAILACLYIF